jgi:hypothetical protein
MGRLSPSTNRSASSRMKKRIAERSTAPCLNRSTILAGVPTMTSTPFFRRSYGIHKPTWGEDEQEGGTFCLPTLSPPTKRQEEIGGSVTYLEKVTMESKTYDGEVSDQNPVRGEAGAESVRLVLRGLWRAPRSRPWGECVPDDSQCSQPERFHQ